MAEFNRESNYGKRSSGRTGGRSSAGSKFGGRSSGRDEGRAPRRDSGRGRDSGRSGFKESFPVVCDKCGVNCEVPFKPSGDKPVLCSDCFRKEGPSRSSSSSSGGMSKEEFELINQKLDKILELLDN